MADILQFDAGAFYRANRPAVDAAVSRVLASGWYVLGTEVAAFECEFAAFLGVKHSIGVASGTDALVLALRAFGIQPGDRVATVSHTAVATVAAVELAGAVPVLVDIDETRLTLCPESLERAFAQYSPIRAVIPVHLYGQPADLEAILAVARRHGALVVEDCAQAHGAAIRQQMVGSLGDIGAFSFYPTKNLGGFGDGGAVATNNPELAERVRVLRQYGWRQRYVSDEPGLNSRLDELQAAILRVRLPLLHAANARRQEIADRYTAGLAGTGLILPVVMSGTTHVFHQYVVRHPDRERLRTYLATRGIGTNIHYPVPVHRQPAYAGRVLIEGDVLPRTDRAASDVLSLPLYPELDDGAVNRVIEALGEPF